VILERATNWLLFVVGGVDGRVARLFLTQYTKTGKIYQITTILQMAKKYTKGPYNIPIGHKIYKNSILRPSKIYPNWDIWFEKYHLATLVDGFVARNGNQVLYHFCKLCWENFGRCEKPLFDFTQSLFRLFISSDKKFMPCITQLRMYIAFFFHF
jgi:hypothetical protein